MKGCLSWAWPSRFRQASHPEGHNPSVIRTLWPQFLADLSAIRATLPPSEQEPPNDTVFHYTGIDVLTANASPGLNVRPWSKWWASSLAFMNDKEELKYGLQLIRNEFAQALSVETDNNFKSVLQAMIDCVPEKELPKHAVDIYCACFSAEGDLLSQWRGYADGGRGVCIGFDKAVLDRLVSGLCFWVLYNEAAQQQLIATSASSIISNIRATYATKGPADAIADLQDWLPIFLLMVSTVIKHPTFSEEREYRVLYYQPVAPTTLEVKFRSRGAAVVPYVELEIYNMGTMPIRHIRLGPGSSWAENIASVEKLFATTGLTPGRAPMIVEKSDIPLV